MNSTIVNAVSNTVKSSATAPRMWPSRERKPIQDVRLPHTLSASIQPEPALLNSPDLVPEERRTPADYDPSLQGCLFAPPSKSDGSMTARVLNHMGEPIGMGRTREQACWLASKVMRAQLLQPDHYHPMLTGCSFGLDAHQGVALRTVTIPTPNGIRILGSGCDKENAATQARLTLLRDKQVNELTPSEFAQVCLFVTVEPVRGKSGKADKGPTSKWLRPDPRVLHSGMNELRQALRDESAFLMISANERVHWAENRMLKLMETKLNNGDYQHIQLGNGQHLILRTYESQSAIECAAHVHEVLCANLLEDAEFAKNQAVCRPRSC